MNTWAQLLMIAAVVSLAGCGSSPDIRYYRLSWETAGVPRAEQSSGIVLAIDVLVGDAAYEDPRIVYRTSPYRLDYYYYHRWTSPPGVLVSDFLRAAYAETGYFKSVVSGFSPEAPIFLSGRVAAFEEVDVEPRKWLARVQLDLHLRSAETGDILWTRTITAEEPVGELTPEGLAEALSRAVGRIVAETAPEFAVIGKRLKERARRARKRSRALESLTPEEEPLEP